MKSFCVLLLGATLLLQGTAAAQGRTADSLRQLLDKQPQADTTRVRRLHALVWEFAANNGPQAMTLNRQGLALARHLADTTGISRSLQWFGILHRRQAAYDSARHYILQFRQLAIRRHDQRRQATACLELSLIDLMQSNHASALSWALQGLPLAEQSRDLLLQTQLRATIGDIYYGIEDYRSAIPMLQKVVHDGQQLGNLQVVSAALNSLASIYQEQKNWALARRYFLRAVQVSRQMGDAQNETVNETGLAETYSLQGDQARAMQHAYRARTLARANHDEFNQPPVELALARIFLLTNHPDSAAVLARPALQLSQQTRSNDNIRNATDILAQAYAALGNFPEAYRYQRLFTAYQDTLTGEATQRKTSALRYGYELDKKQNQIALLTKTRQLQAQRSARQRQQLYGLLGGLAGLVLLAGLLWRNVYIKQRANRHLREKNDQIAQQRDDLTKALAELKATQNQLVQREKMASLGELTAGIAHEIQNPLNFVNNFSEVSAELVAEFMEGPGQQLPEAEKAYAAELLDNLAQNLRKITHHGQRADSIVKGMLQHSHGHTGQREPTNLNTLVTEHASLAYQSFRTKHKAFYATLTPDLEAQLPLLAVVPQDIGRVVLNLCTNAFYAMQQRQATDEASYQPELVMHTWHHNGQVQIAIRDNGSGMSEKVQQKIFQPFFTTKPPGEGTGLGMSLSYDIVVKGHGGTLTVRSREGQGTEVIIGLPVANEHNSARR